MKISLIGIIRKYGYISERRMGRKTLIEVDKKTYDELKNKGYDNLNFYIAAPMYASWMRKYLVGLK